MSHRQLATGEPLIFRDVLGPPEKVLIVQIFQNIRTPNPTFLDVSSEW